LGAIVDEEEITQKRSPLLDGNLVAEDAAIARCEAGGDGNAVS
jgi:hypothetical protein